MIPLNFQLDNNKLVNKMEQVGKKVIIKCQLGLQIFQMENPSLNFKSGFSGFQFLITSDSKLLFLDY